LRLIQRDRWWRVTKLFARVPKLTELGNAQRFARMHGSRMRYVHTWRKWLLWDGQRWRRDEIGSEDTAAK